MDKDKDESQEKAQKEVTEYNQQTTHKYMGAALILLLIISIPFSFYTIGKHGKQEIPTQPPVKIEKTSCKFADYNYYIRHPETKYCVSSNQQNT